MARSIDSIENELSLAKEEFKNQWDHVESNIKSQFSITTLIQNNPIEAVTVSVIAGLVVGSTGVNSKTVEALKNILATYLVSQARKALE